MRKLKPFPKRTYASPRELFSDLYAIFSRPMPVWRAMHGSLVSSAFRERLMLVVTQVNDCRYCSRFHSAQALKVGVSAEDVNLLMKGDFPQDAPPQEGAALDYARHWAENNAGPAEVEKRRLIEVYGQEIAQIIHILLCMIRIGNLSGNTWDLWLYRLSAGRLGLPKPRSSEA